MDDVVSCDDLFGSMAESLLEGHSFYTVPQIDDVPPPIIYPIKPPRDIFYRNTELFLKKPPKIVAPRRCSCMYLCTGAVANVKCLTCSLTDPAGNGFFCNLCYTARHPWYRVDHVSTPIQNDEEIEFTRKIAKTGAELMRCEREGNDVIKQLKVQQEICKVIADDEKIDDKIRETGRNTMDLESRVHRLRITLRDELKTAGANLPMDMYEAVQVLQRAYRGWRIRQAVSLLYVEERIVLVFDETSRREFYYDEKTFASTWIPPRFVLKRHLSSLKSQTIASDKEPHEQLAGGRTMAMMAATNLLWSAKMIVAAADSKFKKNPRAVFKCKFPVTDGLVLFQAAKIVINFGRCVLARQRVIKIADQRIRRVWNADFSTYYYYYILTGESSWHKPTGIYLARSEPPLYVDDTDGAAFAQITAAKEEAAEQEKKKIELEKMRKSKKAKRNPKFNREKLA